MRRNQRGTHEEHIMKHVHIYMLHEHVSLYILIDRCHLHPLTLQKSCVHVETLRC